MLSRLSQVEVALRRDLVTALPAIKRCMECAMGADEAHSRRVIPDISGSPQSKGNHLWRRVGAEHLAALTTTEATRIVCLFVRGRDLAETQLPVLTGKATMAGLQQTRCRSCLIHKPRLLRSCAQRYARIHVKGRFPAYGAIESVREDGDSPQSRHPIQAPFLSTKTSLDTCPIVAHSPMGAPDRKSQATG